VFLYDIPNIELNQHLENPIKPKQFAMKKVIKHENGEESKKEEKM
jgi:hypothetical protein